jgi:tetratricopeptide (TPR) repeat protein
MSEMNGTYIWVFPAAMVAIGISPLPLVAKIALIIVVFLVMLLLKRKTFLYLSASRHIAQATVPEQKDWDKLEKALAMGLPEQMRVTSASLYIQKGDWRKGKAILDAVITAPAGKNEKEHQGMVNVAKIMRSMTSWLDGDLDGAINEVAQVYQSGYRDKNLFINYETYVLEKGDLKTAKQLLEESSDREHGSLGIQDNHAWYLMLTGAWEEATALYDVLFNLNPRFPEPYVHMAQIKLHYGLCAEAISWLQKAKDARYTQTSGIKKDFVERLVALLSNPSTRLATAKAVDGAVAQVAIGKMPAIPQGYPPTEADVLDGFAPLPQQEEEEVQGDTDDRLPDTDLSSDDEEYLKRHGLE